MPERTSDVGLALAVAAIATLSGAAYLWIADIPAQAMALTVLGLGAAIASGPFLFNWSVKGLAPAGQACAGCGYVPGPEALVTPFCMMCGMLPKARPA